MSNANCCKKQQGRKFKVFNKKFTIVSYSVPKITLNKQIDGEFVYMLSYIIIRNIFHVQ